MRGGVTPADQLQEPVLQVLAGGHLLNRARRAHLATCVHIFSTSAMTCEEMITVPPVRAYSMRMSLRLALDTGSTDSNGSSSTSTRGLWIMAAARQIFLVMPAE